MMYGMYMTRITTASYGTLLLHLNVINVLMTLALTLIFGGYNYLAIYVSSGVLLSLMEYWMYRRGMRTSSMFVYGKQVSPLTDSFLKGGAEGPGLCVPALFAADQLYAGHYLIGIVVPCVILALWSGYWAFLERRAIDALEQAGQKPIINRRWMNKPEMVFFVGIINLIVAVSIINMQPGAQRHAVYFILMFFLVLQVFFIVHAYFGVRRIDKYDPETKIFAPAGRRFSFLGYTYDSIFEMALLNTPYYLIPYALGLIAIAS